MKRKTNDIIVRKQTLIDQTRRTVFMWVAGVSCLIGASVVILIMLVQALIFNEKVLAEKGKTVKQLQSNIVAAKELKGSINVLNTNEELKSVRTSEDVPPLQSVLDALPADSNDLALGASLQQKLLKNVPGVKIESVSFSNDNVTGGSTDSSGGASSQPFTLSISGTPEDLRTALERLERSIRAVDIRAMSGSSYENKVTLQISGSMSYLPPVKVEMNIMKKTDIAMIILVASICMAITFFAVRSFFGNMVNKEKTVKTIEPIRDGLTQPSKLIFNSNAINPTVEIYVDNDIHSSEGAQNRLNNQNNEKK